MAALLWKTIQQRALRLLGACALLIGAGTVSAQSYTLALPPAQTCAAGAASAPGNYPFNVGRWFSPQRLGPSWDFFFNNYGQLTAMWYGFDSAGRPVWYISETQYLETLANGDQIWRTKVRRTNQADGAPIVVSTVGEIALNIIAGQPDQMALRWAIDGTGALPDDDRVDCVVRRGSAAAGPTTRVTSSSYSGYWYAPSNSGWGINVLMLPPGTDNPTQWVEENAVAIYDIDTNPSWFLAERLSVGAPSALMQTLPLSYVRWNAAAGAPNGRCTQACSSALSTSGSFSRRYDAADIGAVAVSMVGAVNGQNFSFIRGQTSVPLPTLKLTDAHGISATPSPCQASVGSVSCVVNVEWDGAPNIFGVSSRPFYREIGATARTALSSAIEGALPVTLETGKR